MPACLGLSFNTTNENLQLQHVQEDETLVGSASASTGSEQMPSVVSTQSAAVGCVEPMKGSKDSMALARKMQLKSQDLRSTTSEASSVDTSPLHA